MPQRENKGARLLLAFMACLAATGCDEAAVDDFEEDTGSDGDADDDTEVTCGALDHECCPDRTCEDAAAACVRTDTEGEVLYVCRTSCEPDLCTEGAEGVAGAACSDVSGGNGLGVCLTAQDMGAPLEADNACEPTETGNWGAFNGYCCPISLGGDGLGFGEGDGETGLASMCDGIDMSALAQATSYDDLIYSGVGVCVSNGSSDASQLHCAVPCAFDNSCDLLHACEPFEPTGQQGGACAPYDG